MIKTSIVVQFGSVTDAHLAVELDSELNGGRSSFQKGDSVYFRVYADVNYTVYESSGSTQKTQTKKTENVEDLVSFLENVGSTSKYIKTYTSVTWYGTSGGTVTKIGATSLKCGTPTTGSIGLVKYTTEFDVWKLTPPTFAGDSYAILIVIQGA